MTKRNSAYFFYKIFMAGTQLQELAQVFRSTWNIQDVFIYPLGVSLASFIVQKSDT